MRDFSRGLAPGCLVGFVLAAALLGLTARADQLRVIEGAYTDKLRWTLIWDGGSIEIIGDAIEKDGVTTLNIPRICDEYLWDVVAVGSTGLLTLSENGPLEREWPPKIHKPWEFDHDGDKAVGTNDILKAMTFLGQAVRDDD